jgi:hypothetical protein
MAQESYFETSLIPTLYFFTDKDTKEVVAIHMYSILGIMKMDQSIQDWRPASREEEDFSNYINGSYNIFEYDWESEPYDVTDENWRADDLQDWYPTVTKAWAKGETVTEDDLAPYAKKLESNFIAEVSEKDLVED